MNKYVGVGCAMCLIGSIVALFGSYDMSSKWGEVMVWVGGAGALSGLLLIFATWGLKDV